MRRADPGDLPLLVNLMTEFYSEGGYSLNRKSASDAFAAILADERLGFIWLIQAEQQDVGHLVLTFRFAMEYGGIVAYVDDLYVTLPWRNKGLSTAALVEVRDLCKTAGIRALTVEVGYHNAPAQAAYRKVGFVEAADRQILALALAAPTHSLE